MPRQTPLRAVWAGVWLVPATIFYASLVILSAALGQARRWTLPIARRWARSILRAAKVRLVIEGWPGPPPSGPVLFMSNHQSVLDVLALAIALPNDVRFVAKTSLQYLPFFGWAISAARVCVFIDRKNFSQALGSLKRAQERVRTGVSVVIFPEGTRSREGTLGPFKKGPFHLALAAAVPIVPVAIQGARALMPPGAVTLRSGELRVRFGAPISVPPEATVPALSGEVHRALRALLGHPDDVGKRAQV